MSCTQCRLGGQSGARCRDGGRNDDHGQGCYTGDPPLWIPVEEESPGIRRGGNACGGIPARGHYDGRQWAAFQKHRFVKLLRVVLRREGSTHRAIHERILLADALFWKMVKHMREMRTAREVLEGFYGCVGTCFLHSANELVRDTTRLQNLQAWENNKLRRALLFIKGPSRTHKQYLQTTTRRIHCLSESFGFQSLP